MQHFIFTLSNFNLKIIQSEAGKWITGIQHNIYLYILQCGITIILIFYVFVVHVHDHVSKRLHIQQRILKNKFKKKKQTKYIQRLTLIEIRTQFFLTLQYYVYSKNGVIIYLLSIFKRNLVCPASRSQRRGLDIGRAGLNVTFLSVP